MKSAADLSHLVHTFSFVPMSLVERAARFAGGESLLGKKLVTSPLLHPILWPPEPRWWQRRPDTADLHRIGTSTMFPNRFLFIVWLVLRTIHT
jgi:hypothetical protein